MAVVQVEHVAGLVAQHVGRLPQQGGDRGIGGQAGGVGAPHEAVLGVGADRHVQVDATIGGGHGLLASRPEQHDAERVVRRLLDQPPMRGGEGVGRELGHVGGGEAAVADAVVDGIDPRVEQQAEGGRVVGP